MATVNQRSKKPQAHVVNGIDAGGMMSARISYGYDNIIETPFDGLALPVRDKEIQFVRGTVETQDWTHIIDLLTGAVGTSVFYERKSGVAAATGYLLYTLTNPVIHRASINLGKGGLATCSYDFECKPADETKTITDMLAITDSQSAPTYVSAARGGYRIVSTTHGGALTIYHVTSLNFSIAMNLVKACNDGDIGYTCCEAELENMVVGGSIGFQDSGITSSKLLAQQLATAAAADLVLTCTQSQGATSKVITIANVDFDNADQDSAAGNPFSGHNLNFGIANDAAVPLTLDGANKIITIANAA